MVGDAATMLSPDSLREYLIAREQLGVDAPVEVTELRGGVSSVVLAATAPGLRVAVKQSLPRLRVTDEWLADQTRALTEVEALRLCGRLTPDDVPRLLDVDEEALAFTIELAPAGWRPWKELLLAGVGESGIAARLGSVLARWHSSTRVREGMSPRFLNLEPFDQLRLDPYYRTTMARRPELSDAIAPYLERLLSTRRCLVHGDYSPKNVLVGPEGQWVIDFEVAHRGDPAFDLAFMLNHLLLKAVHLPASREAYERCAFAFWRAYHDEIASELVLSPTYVLGQVACLMLARVDGKSPVEYLTEDGRARTRRLGEALITAPPDTLGGAWSRLR